MRLRSSRRSPFPASAREPLLELEHVTRLFGGGPFSRTSPTVALHDFSLVLPSSEPKIVALAGESGSGKTTAARVVLGLLAQSAGRALYRGVEIRRLVRADELAFRREVQAIPQDPFEAFNPFYKVDHVFSTLLRRFGVPRRDRQMRISEALDFVGLDPRETLGRYPHQLSGGQRQRVMIARALLVRPRLMVADEPVSMVDASLRFVILDVMRRLQTEFGISFLYITHDLSTAYHFANDIIVLHRGAIVEAGPAREVIGSPTHPYTKLLVSCVPAADPNARWQGDIRELIAAAEGNVS